MTVARNRIRRYEVLLRVRQRQEDMKAQVLAARRGEHAALRRDRRRIEEQRRALLNVATVPRRSVVDPQRQQHLYRHERYLGRVADTRDAEIALHATKVRAARAELESAMAQRRIMEKLIERAAAEERARRLAHEQREHDESSVIRFNHARRRELRTES